MREPRSFLQLHTAEDIDRALLLVVAANALGALWLGVDRAQPTLALSVAGALSAVAVAAVVLARGRLMARMLLSFTLTALVALQIHLSGGVLTYHFNVFVSMSLLLAYRDWRPILGMAGLFAVHHIAFDRMLLAGWGTYCLAAPDMQEILLHIAFVVAQAGILGSLAMAQARKARESTELEFLVNAMGREGQIRLNLDVIRAETPAGKRLQHVQHRMADAVKALQAASLQVAASAQQVASGSTDLMARTGATASGLNESAMSLDQIGIIVEHSNEASSETKLMSSRAAGMADQGNQLVSDVVQTMQAIESSSRRINDIIAVIDGIAFQTNILALNAAIEAARAGEQGRGFAVVASEVRSLAQRSADAAREIKGLISTSTTTIAAGTRLVADAGHTMNDLVDSVRKVGELFQSVTADTSQQMEGLRSVSESISSLSHMTQDNVTVAQDAEGAANELREQVERMTQVLGAFRLSTPAAGAAAARATSPPADRPQASSDAAAAAPRAVAGAAVHRAGKAKASAEPGVVEYF
jgi:methyl-accepting chemotaxis protein